MVDKSEIPFNGLFIMNPFQIIEVCCAFPPLRDIDDKYPGPYDLIKTADFELNNSSSV